MLKKIVLGGCIYLSLLLNLHHFASSREEQREGKGSVLLHHQGGMDFIFFKCLPINVWIHNILRFRSITICFYCDSSLHGMQCTDFYYVLFLLLLMKNVTLHLKKIDPKRFQSFGSWFNVFLILISVTFPIAIFSLLSVGSLECEGVDTL